jgi:hypothetical protein
MLHIGDLESDDSWDMKFIYDPLYQILFIN